MSRLLAFMRGVTSKSKSEVSTGRGPMRVNYRLTDRFLRNSSSGLRAGDALHLAIAKNHGAHHVYTLDQGLVKAAIALGLPASTGS